jgi:energy-coupling factor transporter ATP-binding protein EcfA2
MILPDFFAEIQFLRQAGMRRRFINLGIAELEAEYERQTHDQDSLQDLIAELGYRKGARAARLRDRATHRLAAIRGGAPTGRPAASSPRERAGAAPPRPPSLGAPAVASRRNPLPAPPRTPAPRWAPPETTAAEWASSAAHSSRPGTPESVCDAWTALEVLSPHTYVHPHELAKGPDREVVKLEGTQLPWEGGRERSRPNKRIFYQVVLGSIDMAQAAGRLLATFTDTRPERAAARGRAALAVVIVDSAGRPAGPPAVHLSSFGWGLPRALRRELRQLAAWPDEEPRLLEAMEKLLRRTDEDGELIPLRRADLDGAYRWLIRALGVPEELAAPPELAVRNYVWYGSKDPPEPVLLNSFFLRDLATVRAGFAAGRSTRLLRQYLGVEAPRHRPDLLTDFDALERAVAPGITPSARWPGPGRHPLVLLQQAAVNLATTEARDGGIVAVNGPPGTGKTTLLRDLVAAIVTARAEVMAEFDDPAAAFVDSREKITSGGTEQHLYRLDPRLRGFEMVVASSNNKAVENVSAELPGLGAVADDATGLRYFKTLSDALRGQETWGLIAAVLGNATNRGRFSTTFWKDSEVGMATYLLHAAGTPQVIRESDPRTGAVAERPPRIVAAEAPPRDRREALERWRAARAAFLTAVARSRAHLDALGRARDHARSLPALARAEVQAAHDRAAAAEAERVARAGIAPARQAAEGARDRLSAAERALAEQDSGRPGFLARLFRTQTARDWQAARASLAGARDRARTAAADAVRARSAAEEALAAAEGARVHSERNLAEAATRHATVRAEVALARSRIGSAFVDAEFFGRDHEVRQTATPWLDANGQRLRDDVFIAAMQLHRAFIDAAAVPLRHNLDVLMGPAGLRKLSTTKKRALLPDLWSSLFLVVPLVSTTFASVEKMFRDLPPETFGWLLVDEAGQALPQAAAGALLRARRAVVVGDPLQIEPVVTLPESLTDAICRHFSADPDRYNAPAASVQTLADAATPYGAEFQVPGGSRSVGVPLLVHRRCDDPMFGISNAVAYNRLMVQAKRPATSPIGAVLGTSRWIHVEGSALEKWSPEEGEAVLRLLAQLRDEGVAPDLYIVTPFVVVAEQLRRRVRDSRVLEGWVGNARDWPQERIGTVHTVQGREAEAVIFILGAPAYEQTGARGWAGARPNLLNVAVTRAKERLYVVGNRRLWRAAGLFGELDARLPASR